MSTGSRYARIRRGADVKNTVYPWNRSVVPSGSETSNDHVAVLRADTVGASSTDFAAGTDRSRRCQR